MKENDFLDGVSNIEADVVERFVDMDNKLQKKAKKPRKSAIWLRVGIIAACCVLVFGAVIAMLMLREEDPRLIPGADTSDDSREEQESSDTDTSVIDPPVNILPPISTVVNGNEITGKQELIYGDPSSESEGDAEMIAPGFEIQTVIEAEIVEVLPDTYYYAASYYQPLHIAKLRVVDQIRGEGLPAEIYLCYPYYDVNVFDGYERFIMSLEQVGIENYALVNGTQSRVDYFSNMFEVCLTRDLGYGSVIAFNGEKVDDSFWNKTDYLLSSLGSGYLDTMLDPTIPLNYYPASRNSGLGEVKENILALAEDKDNWHLSENKYDYVTADDVFISDEAKAIKEYLTPADGSVFVHSLTLREDRVIAEFTRIINGFKTDESICINGYNGENGNVLRRGGVYTAENFENVPNIGEAIEKMDLSELQPSHIEIVDGMYFKYANAMGVYRNVDGKIYGIVRIIWNYTFPKYTNGYIRDDCYYLYDENGNGSVVERDELKELIGNDSIIAKFSYAEIIEWD